MVSRPISRVRVILPMAASPGQSCCSCNQAISCETTLVRVSIRPCSLSIVVCVVVGSEGESSSKWRTSSYKVPGLAFSASTYSPCCSTIWAGGGPLAVHRIGGDDRALQRQQRQQLRHGR